ncbi:hypothetical protein [Actinoplanes sp. NPDC026670]|jgi:hypothetical protein|uniref:hypothetical protein n=1 Tax=Actinoplanes sp. NPDC026670 TaxID=3154700 RepID=UPI0033FFCB4C
MKRVFGAVIIGAAMTAGALTVASPALAAECNPSVSAPSKSGSTISGSVSRPNCGTGSGSLNIQRSRWFGWETVATKKVTGSSSISYNCAGTGTHEFRVMYQDASGGGVTRVRTSSGKNYSC